MTRLFVDKTETRNMHSGNYLDNDIIIMRQMANMLLCGNMKSLAGGHRVYKGLPRLCHMSFTMTA